MIGFLSVYLILIVLYQLLWSGKTLSHVDRLCISIFCSLLTLSYVPQLSSLLFGTLQLPGLLIVCLILLLLVSVYERKRISVTSIRNAYAGWLSPHNLLSLGLHRDPYLVGLALVSAASLVLIFWVTSQFSNFGWDGWTYHSSAIAWFNQNDRIVPMPLMPWVIAYPKNIEFLSLWFYLFDGHDRWIDAVNGIIHVAVLPFAYTLGKRVGLSRSWSLAAAFVYFLTPTLISQTWTTYVDQPFADGIVMMLFFTLKWNTAKDNRLFWSVMLGLSLGFLAQVKGTGLHIILITAMILIVHEAIYRRFRSSIPFILTVGAVAATTGGGWYLFNWYLYANPFYPFKIMLPGTDRVLFDGLWTLKDSMLQNFQTRMDLDVPWWKLYLREFAFGGWGLHFFCLGLPSMVFVLLRGNNAIRWLVLFALLVLLIVPFSYIPRYTIAVSIVGALAFCLVVQEIFYTKAWSRVLRTTSIVLILFALTPLFQNINPRHNNEHIPPPRSEFAVTDGFKRFDVVNGERPVRIGVVSLELRSDNPYWYFYFGPRWHNIVEPYDRAEKLFYDFIICGKSSLKCSEIRSLQSHKLIFEERNVEVYRLNDNVKS